MFNKKAQGEIITTVLIILLVLAAIVIVWQVVNSTVNRAGDQAESASSCIGMVLSVVDTTKTATSLTAVRVERGNDVMDLKGIKVIVEDATGLQKCNIDVTASLPLSMGQANLAVVGCAGLTATTSYKVRVAPKIGSNQCSAIAYADFATL